MERVENMKEIKCPKCGEVFAVDESGYCLLYTSFLVAVDKETGKIAGFLNGIATDEEVFRDEFFTDITLHNRKGKNIMLLGLDVLPEYRGQGLASEIMERYLKREQEIGRKRVVLTCLDEKVKMYEKMGYKDLGICLLYTSRCV